MSSGDESYTNTSSMSEVELLQLARKGESLLIHLFSPIKLKKKDVTGEDEDDIDHNYTLCDLRILI